MPGYIEEPERIYSEGNSLNMSLSDISDLEIRADMIVGPMKSRRIWGQIKDCTGRPVKNALIKLVKVVQREGRLCYIGIAHTMTDCEGFYQLNIYEDFTAHYKILVSQAYSGCETIIQSRGGNCSPCGCPVQRCQNSSHKECTEDVSKIRYYP